MRRSRAPPRQPATATEALQDVVSQYCSGLAMQSNSVSRSCEAIRRMTTATRHLAYHAIFYIHLYLSPTEEKFLPREKSRARDNFFSDSEWVSGELIEDYIPYVRPYPPEGRTGDRLGGKQNER